MGALILVAIVLVLWYLSAIPGLPPINSVVEPLKQLGTLVPPASELPTLAAPTPLSGSTPAGALALGSGQRPRAVSLPEAQSEIAHNSYADYQSMPKSAQER